MGMRKAMDYPLPMVIVPFLHMPFTFTHGNCTPSTYALYLYPPPGKGNTIFTPYPFTIFLLTAQNNSLP